MLQITEVDRLMEIIRQAGQAEALVFFTLADPYMADAAKEACQVKTFLLFHMVMHCNKFLCFLRASHALYGSTSLP